MYYYKLNSFFFRHGGFGLVHLYKVSLGHAWNTLFLNNGR